MPVNFQYLVDLLSEFLNLFFDVLHQSGSFLHHTTECSTGFSTSIERLESRFPIPGIARWREIRQTAEIAVFPKLLPIHQVQCFAGTTQLHNLRKSQVTSDLEQNVTGQLEQTHVPRGILSLAVEYAGKDLL